MCLCFVGCVLVLLVFVFLFCLFLVLVFFVVIFSTFWRSVGVLRFAKVFGVFIGVNVMGIGVVVNVVVFKFIGVFVFVSGEIVGLNGEFINSTFTFIFLFFFFKVFGVYIARYVVIFLFILCLGFICVNNELNVLYFIDLLFKLIYFFMLLKIFSACKSSTTVESNFALYFLSCLC